MMNEELDRLVTELEGSMLALGNANTANIRKVRRKFSAKLQEKKPKFVLQLALRLLGKESLPRFLAYELIHCHREALRSLNSRDLERLGRGLDSWGAVDAFACYLAGPAWRERQVSDHLIHRWAGSADRWWRRAALVSTVPLNNRRRGGKGDRIRTLRVCRILLHDRDDMIVKAMSWSLRELSKRDAPSVRSFLRRYEKQLALRVIREVRKNLARSARNWNNGKLG